jgi:DNA-binding MarR family transcriptional regulator
MPDDPLAQLDLGLAALFAGQTIADEVRDRVEERGFVGLRVSHGFIVQRLVDRERAVSDIAESMGVTQQAVSKTVSELEGLGYVRRRPAPDDARVRLVALTDLGRRAVTAAREERAAVEAELRARIGPRRVAAATRVLREVLEVYGATAAVRMRRVRPPA